MRDLEFPASHYFDYAPQDDPCPIRHAVTCCEIVTYFWPGGSEAALATSRSASTSKTSIMDLQQDIRILDVDQLATISEKCVGEADHVMLCNCPRMSVTQKIERSSGVFMLKVVLLVLMRKSTCFHQVS